MQNGNLKQSMTRDQDRMSPVLRSMIKDDQSLNDLTFRLVHNGTRRWSESCNESLFVSVVNLPRRRQRTAWKNQSAIPETTLASEEQSNGRQSLSQINTRVTAGPNTCGGRKDKEVLPATKNIRR